MAQKRSLTKITDFMAPSSSRAQTDDVELSPPTKQSSHHNTFDLKWNNEFPWAIYVPPTEDGGVSML